MGIFYIMLLFTIFEFFERESDRSTYTGRYSMVKESPLIDETGEATPLRKDSKNKKGFKAKLENKLAKHIGEKVAHSICTFGRGHIKVFIILCVTILAIVAFTAQVIIIINNNNNNNNNNII